MCHGSENVQKWKGMLDRQLLISSARNTSWSWSSTLAMSLFWLGTRVQANPDPTAETTRHGRRTGTYIVLAPRPL